MFKSIFLFLIIFIFWANSIFASEESVKNTLNKALVHFQNAEYSMALSTLKTIPSKEVDAKINYWTAQCEFKLQHYYLSAKHFQEVAKQDLKKEFSDNYYLLGQSYYAIQDYKYSKLAFDKSVLAGYKVGASLYYSGYIENIIGSNEKALEILAKIQQLPKEDSEMKQPALFQTGEIYFELSKKFDDKHKAEKEKLLMTKAIPAYQSSVLLDEKSALAKQAKGRLQELHNKMSAETPKTKAGLAKPKQAWLIKVSQDVKYDSNILNESDGKLIKASYAGSFLEKTGFFAKYEFNIKDRVILTPELDASATFHSRRKVAAVFTSDTAGINPAIRSRIDHIFMKKPASGLVEIETTYTSKDYKANHNQLFSSKTINYVLGERAQVFPWAFTGNTTLKAGYKYSVSYNYLQNYRAPSVTLIQSWVPFPIHTLTSTFTFEGQFAKDIFNDQRSWKVNNSYSIPSFYWGTSLDIALNMTFLDTMHQSATRGNEITTNPSLTFTKNFSDQLAANLSYNFTRNSSRDNTSYTYSKHVIGLGASFTF